MAKENTELATYTFNIRSFHPKKYFPITGFRGDNRGFNVQDNSRINSSRIWHKLEADLVNGSFTETTRSHPSKHPLLGESTNYSDSAKKPKARLTASRRNISNGRTGFLIEGHYHGSNHAMPLSEEMKKLIGTTYVPEIDVNYTIRLDIDRREGLMDLVTYITGDGFPNCEAFIVGPDGQRLFLGVHVRGGTAVTRLTANLDRPMIACAIRLPLANNGSFKGTVGNELARRIQGRRKIEYQSFEEWNNFFRNMNPNGSCPTVPTESELERCFP